MEGEVNEGGIMDTTETITHTSLCAGYGGIDVGLGRVIPGLRTVVYVEVEAFACANLVAKMEAEQLDAAPIWTNLKTFPWECSRGVGILSGGYPCQPFSAAGKRRGKDDPRHLWPYIKEGIEIARPQNCFFENVEGHVSKGLSDVLQDLEEMGYLTTWGLFSAAEVGAPHGRKRVFILGRRRDLGKLADSDGSRRREDKQPAELRAVGSSEPSGGARVRVRAGASTQGQEGPEEGELANGEGIGLPELSKEGAVRGEVCSVEDGSRDVEHAGGTGRAEPHVASQSDKENVTGGFGDEGLCIRRWPSRPGEQQRWWEPPRTVLRDKGKVANATRELRHGAVSSEEQAGLTEPSDEGIREAQPKMGGNIDGPSSGVGYAELCVAFDNRTDELRMLGNGVVPAMAAKAWIILNAELDEWEACEN